MNALTFRLLRTGGRRTHAALLLALLALLLTVVGTGCDTAGHSPLTPNAPTGKVADTTARDHPLREPLVLPTDPGAATEALRQRLIALWRPLLQKSGIRYLAVRFRATSDGHYGPEASMSIRFWGGPVAPATASGGLQSPAAAPAAHLERAARSSGWTRAGVSHGLSVRKGPFRLSGLCQMQDCWYEIAVDEIDQLLDSPTPARALRTPELEQFAAPRSGSDQSTSPTTRVPVDVRCPGKGGVTPSCR
ncbi:hypothetical protein [Luteipulveratus mongoliensis]|uniref:Uncharacterized protein n=1 Tax=Luteipulveratus mongoliensis TaxID=571913 RepID=A0A0K1JNN1_9MICO|nr:hypothetical protein [Luteipulveratus mongoliensis]AKU18311.1 hypothetical protein VV02_24805 [Luteipulveratus mongoliensis]